MDNKLFCRIAELRSKEAINLNDGSWLGYICDLEFELETGRILSIIVPGPMRFFWFFPKGEYVIKWSDIEKIGEDIIMVSYEYPPDSKRNKKRTKSKSL